MCQSHQYCDLIVPLTYGGTLPTFAWKTECSTPAPSHSTPQQLAMGCLSMLMVKSPPKGSNILTYFYEQHENEQTYAHICKWPSWLTPNHVTWRSQKVSGSSAKVSTTYALIECASANHDRLTPPGVKNVTYIFGVPLCRVSGPWLYTAYIHIHVSCFTQIHEVNVKMLHYIFRLGKQIYKSNL